MTAPAAAPWHHPIPVVARRCRAVLALLAIGLGGGVGAQGLVQGVLGLAVAPAPGQAPALQLRGNVALRLEQRVVDGKVWRQLLASDGNHGWTAQALGEELPVTARALGKGFDLLPLPPGSVDFLSALGQPVPEDSVGRLLGGSLAGHAAGAQELMVPAWLSPGLAPWPRWSMAGIDGYAPLALVGLSWPGPAVASPGGGTSHDMLGAWGLNGLSREPFLAPASTALKALAPGDGALALDLSPPPATAPARRVLRGNWQGPLCAYRAASVPAGGLAALLCFGQGKARAFVFQGREGAQLVAYTDDDSVGVARLEEADLDGDGRPEWLLETVGVYGDGYYSELWVVNGRSAGNGLRVQRLALSRSSGEMPTSGQVAAWGVDDKRRLWVWHSTAKGSRLSTLRFVRGALRPAAAPFLVVLDTNPSHVAAQQRHFQALPGAARRQETNDVMLLPRQTVTGLQWVIAIASPGRPQATRLAKQLALPAAAVQALPWRP